MIIKYIKFYILFPTWKRNGKGKKYNINNNKLKSEGEYLNGQRHRNTRKYYKYGELKFEGEYCNEKKWNRKGDNINGDLEFEIKNGCGRGKEYKYYGELKFEREYIDEM